MGNEGGNVLSGLLAPLRLPERLLRALDELRPMREELSRVREQTEPLADLLPALQRLEDVLGSRLKAVHASVESVDDHFASIEEALLDLTGEVKAMHETLKGLKDDVQRTTGLRGDRGVMERARDVLTGGNQEDDRPV